MQRRKTRKSKRKARAAKNVATARAILEPPLYAKKPTTKRTSNMTPVRKVRRPMDRKRVQSLLEVKLRGTGQPSRSASNQIPTAMKIRLPMAMRTSVTRLAVRPFAAPARYAVNPLPW